MTNITPAMVEALEAQIDHLTAAYLAEQRKSEALQAENHRLETLIAVWRMTA